MAGPRGPYGIWRIELELELCARIELGLRANQVPLLAVLSL